MDDLCLLLDDGQFVPVAYLYNVFSDMSLQASEDSLDWEVVYAS
jgi:hypothetical protein